MITELPNITDKELLKFYSNIDILGDEANDCWIWIGTKGNSFGHGSINICNQYLLAHRVSYMIEYGKIEDGMLVLHDPILCNNPSCVNPNHLRLGTHQDNMDDKVSIGNHHHTNETKLKISIATNGKNNPMYGKRHSKETKDKIGKSGLGRVTSDDTKARISRSLIGKTKGKIVSKETRLKLSRAQKGKLASNETKKKMSDSHKLNKNHNYVELSTANIIEIIRRIRINKEPVEIVSRDMNIGKTVIYSRLRDYDAE